ncbi:MULTISPECIES: general stress protein [unclassified Bacillus (in: firmicutes)]|uniref:general stress protein n=1 Tax=unclassified Bacillus (in: firmicutes) TaxID=185979 RepID=UPI0008E96C7B|nr:MULTISPECIES: general stress protein [unclassified Bacillus (in: firmicutes)]SFB07736.1 Heat induced stress protein YflT [Bacillus sp. UNCCL13]SFQ87254.1 Heat induced stress protein YflT [Bacillus sp. cl95]
MDKRIVGVYDHGDEAVRAIEELKAQGYERDDISVVARDKDEVEAIHTETGTKADEGLATGAATGGVLGGLAGFLAGVGALAIPGVGPIIAAGPIAATLTGAAVGAGAGGLAGALIGMGIPEDEANRYESDVKSGKILVLVDRDAKTRTTMSDVVGMTGTTETHTLDDVEQNRNGLVDPYTGAGNFGDTSLDRSANKYNGR